MDQIRFILAFLVCAALTAGAADAPAVSSAPSFLLVHLRWVSNQVTVVKSERVPGRLKPQPPAEGGLQVRLADLQGNPVWMSALEDPRRQRFEFPDETQAGGIRQVEKWLPTADVLVRVPFQPAASEFQLLGPVPSAQVALPGGGPQLGATSSTAGRPVLVRLPIQGMVTPGKAP